MKSILDELIRHYLIEQPLILLLPYVLSKSRFCLTNLLCCLKVQGHHLKTGGINIIVPDLSKTFSLVTHHILLEKLQSLKIDMSLKYRIVDDLTDGSFRIDVKFTLSEPVVANSVVPEKVNPAVPFKLLLFCMRTMSKFGANG